MDISIKKGQKKNPPENLKVNKSATSGKMN